MAVPVYILANSVQIFPFFHILANIFICCLFDDSNSDKCEVISHLVLIRISPMINEAEHLFMYLLAIYMSLENCLFRSSDHFLLDFLKYWTEWAVFMFWILSCFYVVGHIICKYFLPFCRFFLLLMVFFVVQKLLSLSRSHLFIFAFVSIALGDRAMKILWRFMSKSILPVFSSRSFLVFGLKFSL